jgi:hypothetical protein
MSTMKTTNKSQNVHKYKSLTSVLEGIRLCLKDSLYLHYIVFRNCLDVSHAVLPKEKLVGHFTEFGCYTEIRLNFKISVAG